MIRLPQFTFLNGPNGSGKTTLAHLLTDQDPGLLHASFADPIRLVLESLFYPDQLFSDKDHVDLRDPITKSNLIPGTSITHRHFMIAFGTWLRGFFSPHIFSDLARRRCEKDIYHPRFLFDDCRFIEELSSFSLAYGESSCLIITLERDGTGFDLPGNVGSSLIRAPGARHMALSNNRAPLDMLATIEAVLGATL